MGGFYSYAHFLLRKICVCRKNVVSLYSERRNKNMNTSDMQLDINYAKLYEIALIRSSVTDAGICIPAFGFVVPR